MKIRAFSIEDLDTMRRWLVQDYVRQFWGDPQDWIQEISANLKTNWIKYFIVEENGPLGFLQYYETDKAPKGDWSEEPIGTVGIDYLIGDKAYLGKGYGSVIVRLLVGTSNQFFSDVSITAKGFFEKHGYVVVKQQLKRSRNKDLINFRMQKGIHS